MQMFEMRLPGRLPICRGKNRKLQPFHSLVAFVKRSSESIGLFQANADEVCKEA